MSKFSDIPFFLLDKYFTDFSVNLDLYILGENKNFLEGNFSPDYTTDQVFKFDLQNNIDIENSSEVYFRKDSMFYTWLISAAEPYYQENWFTDFNIEHYCNPNKDYLYFGNIYLNGGNSYTVKHRTLNSFVEESLPYHQRTTRLLSLFDLYFDRLHSEIYNLMKNMRTLIDPITIDANFLEYLAFLYKFTLSDQFDESAKRIFIENMVTILKRKGTYSSIYDFWYILSNNSRNKINIYERWHDPDLTGDINESDYVDFLYLHNYIDRTDTEYLPGGVGKDYYKNFIPGIQWLLDNKHITIVENKISSWNISHNLDSWNIVAQCYNTNFKRILPSKIEMVDSNNILIEFETAINGYAFISVADITKTKSDFTLDGSDYYTEHTSGYVNTQTYESSAAVLPNLIDLTNNKITIDGAEDYPSLEFLQILNGDRFDSGSDSTTWTILHNKNKKGLIVNTYDVNGELLLPDNLTIGSNTLTTTWSESLSGYVVISEIGNPEDVLNSPYDGDLLLSPHYIVELDLTDEPMEIDKIVDYNWFEDLTDYWEEMRPVDRVSKYRLIIGPIGYYDGNWYDIYNGLNTNLYVKTKFVGVDSSAELLEYDVSDNLIAPTFEVASEQGTSNFECSGLIDTTFYEYNNFIYIVCNIEDTEDSFIIREVRLKNSSDVVIFRMQCSDIEKLKNIWTKIVFKIENNTT